MATSKTHNKVERKHSIEDKFFKIKTKADTTGKVGAGLAMAIGALLMTIAFFGVLGESLYFGFTFLIYLVEETTSYQEVWIPFVTFVIGTIIFIFSLIVFLLNFMYFTSNGYKFKTIAGIFGLFFGIIPGALVLAGKQEPLDKSITKAEYIQIEKIFEETIKEKALLAHFEKTVQVAYEKELTLIRTPLHPKIVDEVKLLLSNKELKKLVKEANKAEKERIKIRKAQRGNIFDRVGDFVTDKYDGIAFSVKEKFDLYEDALASFYNDIATGVRGTYKDFTGKLLKVVEDVKHGTIDKVNEIGGKVKNTFKKPLDAGKKVIDKTTEAITSSASKIGKSINDATEKTKSGFDNLLHKAKDAYTKTVDAVKKTAAKVGIKSKSSKSKSKDEDEQDDE